VKYVCVDAAILIVNIELYWHAVSLSSSP